ncbi:MAG TPA: hypothetical protein V6D07_00245 [Trichocoleus sp.]
MPIQSIRPHTFKSIADDAGVSKRAVQNWWDAAKALHGELGAIEREGAPRRFTDAEQTILLSYAGDRPTAKSQKPQVTVEAGNHCSALSTPDLQGTFSLEQFRSSEAVVFDDPISVAQQFLTVADMLIGAMARDAAAREQRLQQTRQARDKVSTKAQELQLEQRLYRERTRSVDTAQTAETEALQKALATLQALGKPEDGPSGGLS